MYPQLPLFRLFGAVSGRRVHAFAGRLADIDSLGRLMMMKVPYEEDGM
jgi:hypothetical protein